ncbi:MAG: hypothetical protein MUE36_00990 [Acidimicrobiales bacterium]|jgi:hypothetical protein|nr:hypothetical protein [Acidimicrobiales bacterium]
MTVPEAFVGCWTRDGVSVAGEELAEPADVMWLQGREWFADVRVPRPDGRAGPATTALGARAEAFGGRCAWTTLEGVEPAVGGALSWSHEVDWTGGFAEGDGAEARWVADDCFEEHGTVDDDDPPTPFREVWRRQPAEAAPLVVVGFDGESRTTAMSVAVGGRRLVLVDRRSTGGAFAWSQALRDEDGGWRVVRRQVDPPVTVASADVDATPALADAEATADWLDAHPASEAGMKFAGSDTTWVVVEAGGLVHDRLALSKQYRNSPSVRCGP